MKEVPHPEYCNKKLKDIPNTTKPNILQVIPSQPQTTTCEGKTITYRVGGVRLGNPLRIDFAKIFSAIYPLPMAQEEKLLSKQPMYPSDSEQLVYLMNNLDKDFINRAESFFNKPLKSPINMIAQVGNLSPFITIHPRVTLFWGAAPLTSYSKSNTMIGLFLPTETHRPRDLKN